MRRALTEAPLEAPAALSSLLSGARLYDSSCSPEARVWMIDRDGCYFLKRGEKGSLEREAELTRYFHAKGLGTEVLDYVSEKWDWLLTSCVEGEDCTHEGYLSEPKRLCDLYAQILRELHETDPSGCPVKDRTVEYLETVRKNHAAGRFDVELFTGEWAFSSAAEAWALVERDGKYLKADTLLHGDYCLPNVILKDWRLSGLIDLGNGGVGDRHIDLFWGIWTLWFNLKTDRYRDRFLDAYGRDCVEEDLLRVVAAAETFG